MNNANLIAKAMRLMILKLVLNVRRYLGNRSDHTQVNMNGSRVAMKYKFQQIRSAEIRRSRKKKNICMSMKTTAICVCVCCWEALMVFRSILEA